MSKMLLIILRIKCCIWYFIIYDKRGCKLMECTLCHSEHCDLIHAQIRNDDENKFKMYACENCKTHFIYPLPTELEDYYDGQFREEVHTAQYYSVEKLETVFQKFMAEAKRRVARVENDLCHTDEILEIGCSVGYFLAAIQDKVSVAYGTEWDSKARWFIEEQVNSPKIHVKKNPQDFQKKFDKIFLFHVLEHIEDPVQFLTELKPLLKENGKIYIEVPNVDDILVKTYQCQEFMDFYYKKAHLYNFNEKGLQYVFDASGYDYDIRFIQRYDISNHLYWLANRKPHGMGKYADILSEQLDQVYRDNLIKAKQSDTLFAILTL